MFTPRCYEVSLISAHNLAIICDTSRVMHFRVMAWSPGDAIRRTMLLREHPDWPEANNFPKRRHLIATVKQRYLPRYSQTKAAE